MGSAQLVVPGEPKVSRLPLVPKRDDFAPISSNPPSKRVQPGVVREPSLLESTDRGPPDTILAYPHPVILSDAGVNLDLVLEGKPLERLSRQETEWARRSQLRVAHNERLAAPYHNLEETRRQVGTRPMKVDDLTRLAAPDIEWEGFRAPNGIVVLNEVVGPWPEGVSRPNPLRAGPLLAKRIVAHDEGFDVADMVERLARALPEDVVSLMVAMDMTLHLGRNPPAPPVNIEDPCADLREWMAAAEIKEAHGQYFSTLGQAWVYDVRLS